MFGKSGANVFCFECLLEVGAELDGFFAGSFEAFEWFGGIDNPLHLGFDPREVVFADGCGEIEVVVEAVSGGRSEGQPGAWEEPHDGAGHHVGATVAKYSEGFRVAFGDQSQRDWALFGEFTEWPHAVTNHAID